jgi:hypothetical protein
VSKGKAAPRPRARWLWGLAIAAFVAGVYVFVIRSPDVPPALGGAVASPSRPDARGTAGGPVPAPVPLPRPGNGGFPSGVRIIEQKVVELNTATQAEIETLPGITPDYARKIIAGRPYQAMGDLARTGIPRVILDDISPPAVIRSTERGLPPRSPK